MRLKLIKIAGFKSFVEPTKLVLPSELVGIVGPNGCGKSNTLDAVRWVMGESSAKELRGGDMNDVLFNGTDKRKAVSQCSVELIFDNESGQASGPYAAYSEISVKRLHHREEGTSYFLNQRKCRRRDVIDLFNGTGLGPRSYALIGQGNISRIIEAKPEDMRVYLEEVAGIGPYRSRRKETLLRLERTAENLAQLQVLQEALTEQAEHLAIQAEKAKDYRQSLARQQTLEKSVYYYQWQTLHAMLHDSQTLLRDKEKAFAQSKMAWDEAQKAYLLSRQQLPEQQQSLEALEQRFHQLDKEVAQLQQQHAFSEQQSSQWQAQLELNRHQQQLKQQQLQDLAEQYRQLQEEQEAITEQQALVEDRQYELEQSWLHWQQTKTHAEQNQQKVHWQAQQAEQRLQQGRQQQARFEQSAQHYQQQLALLNQTLSHAELSLDDARINEITAERESLNRRLSTLNQTLAALNEQVDHSQTQLDQHQATIRELEQTSQQTLSHRLGLEKIQNSLLKNTATQASEFLQQHAGKLLLDSLDVTAEWREAVESWLGNKLQGLVINQAWLFDQDLPSVPLIAWNPSNSTPQTMPHTLASQIQAPAVIQSWASAVFLRDESQNLAVQLASLPDQAWLIDQNGVMYNRYAVMPPSQQPLLLERQAEIDALSERGKTLDQQLELINAIYTLEAEKHAEQVSQRKQLVDQQAQIERERQRLEDQLSHLHESRQRAQQTVEQYRHAKQELLQKMALEQTQQADSDLDLLALAEEVERLNELEDEANQQLADAIQKTMPMQREREQLQAQLQRLDQQQQQTKQALKQIEFQQQQLQMQLQQDQQQAELISRHSQQSVVIDPIELAQKQQQLAQLGSELQQQKQQLNALEQQTEQLHQQAQLAQNSHHQAEQALVTFQLQSQNVQQQIQTLQKTLQAQGLSLYELSQMRLEEDDNPDELEAELKQVKLHLARLGAVNMTAIEEYEVIKTKLDTLNQQALDLQNSLATLEQAIATIDEDSRQRLKVTFNQVNLGFQALFPKLFQGGEASLSWENPDQDPLEGGIVVMARPPGKRNARIQLLSGGEKTLAALALIFAIFELKPAPFCILDEVDAPLDDANVIRFCGLVRGLSEKVQFIFITHNKTTMALAKHLVGVTMHEAGVSRLVSVDLEAAVEMIGETDQ